MQVIQEPFEMTGFYSLRLKMVKLMIENFPKLSQQSLDVLSNAIISKIQTGQIFSYDLEKAISLIYPVIVKHLNK
jgi:hypothetical protein